MVRGGKGRGWPTEPLTRRSVATGLLASIVAPSAAFGQQGADPLQQLIERNDRRGEFGQSFDGGTRTMRLPRSNEPVLSAQTIAGTEQAVAAYQQIVAQGGWPQVPSGTPLRIGQRNPAVRVLRARLKVSGDLDPAAGDGEIFDSYVEAAVRRFQARHGLSVDGNVRELTFKALNVPADMRLRQLETNVVRIRSMGGFLGNRFVMVNIPAAAIEAVENGVVASRHTAVAGKADRPSPLINSRIFEVNLNPFWTVPASIVRRDLIPLMQNDPEYLQRHRIRIYDPRGQELEPRAINWFSNEAQNYQFRQDPGDHNSLGNVRINFPNQHQVYMHDTPFRNLFGEDFRFHSSGCVRVQNVREFATWLLQGTEWNRARIDEVIRSGSRTDAKLAAPVNLYWVYVTAWSGSDGIVQFRDDIYDRDGIGAVAQR